MATNDKRLEVTEFDFDELKENFVYSETEQEDILRARRRLPRQTILTEGFHPRRKRGQAIPLNRNKYNRDV